MCPRVLEGLLSKTQDEILDFFEKLVWDSCEFEQARENLRYPSHGAYTFHVSPHHRDHLRNSYDPSYFYESPGLYDYCKSSNHDIHNCPYRDYINAICASLGKRTN